MLNWVVLLKDKALLPGSSAFSLRGVTLCRRIKAVSSDFIKLIIREMEERGEEEREINFDQGR